MVQSRTHTCNDLRMEHVGQQVKLVGWMENVREVGQNLAFVVLRDFYGVTQVVIETGDMLAAVKGLNKESTISVEGVVRERDSKNPNMPTGDIEVVPSKIEVLGRCRHNELPFEINHSREADEIQRLRYRYLDLRNPAVKDNIILRCNVVAAAPTMNCPSPSTAPGRRTSPPGSSTATWTYATLKSKATSFCGAMWWPPSAPP